MVDQCLQRKIVSTAKQNGNPAVNRLAERGDRAGSKGGSKGKCDQSMSM